MRVQLHYFPFLSRPTHHEWVTLFPLYRLILFSCLLLIQLEGTPFSLRVCPIKNLMETRAEKTEWRWGCIVQRWRIDRSWPAGNKTFTLRSHLSPFFFFLPLQESTQTRLIIRPRRRTCTMDPRELRIGEEKPRGRSWRQSLQEAPFVVGTAVSFLHIIESIRLENRLERKQKVPKWSRLSSQGTCRRAGSFAVSCVRSLKTAHTSTHVIDNNTLLAPWAWYPLPATHGKGL